MGRQSLLYALSVFVTISVTSSSAEDVTAAGTSKPRMYITEVTQGDYDAILQNVDTRYYIPDRYCSGLLTVDYLGCGDSLPVALWVRMADSGRAPSIKISDNMDQVIVRRENRAADTGDCPGRLWIQLKSACEAPSVSTRREMNLHNHPKFHRVVFMEEDQQEHALISRRRRNEPLQLRGVIAEEHIPDVVALEEIEEND